MSKGQGDIPDLDHGDASLGDASAFEDDNNDLGNNVYDLASDIAELELGNDSKHHVVELDMQLATFTHLILDEDVCKTESHFLWMVQLDKEAVLHRDRIEVLKAKMLSWVSESDSHLSVCQNLTQKLLLAVYSAYLTGDSEETNRFFDEANQVNQDATVEGTEPNEHILVYRYMVVINKLIVTYCWDILKSETNPEKLYDSPKLAELKEELKKFNPKTAGISGPNCEATILALKGQLANQLGRTTEAVEFYKEAANLNPLCFDWTYHWFTSLRRQRREHDFMKCPSQQEIDVCRRAYKLRTTYWRTYLSMANLHEDIHKSKAHTYNEENTEGKMDEILTLSYRDHIMKTIEYMKKARDLAPTNVSVHLKLGEAYTRDLSSLENIQHCQELFELCISKWPENSQVWHKAGKCYTQLLLAKKTNNIPQRSDVECFEKALELDSANFPCCMDYLRVICGKYREKSSINLVIEKINKYLPAYRYKRLYEGKLIGLRGYLLWILDDHLSAIKDWMHVFDVPKPSDEYESKLLMSYLKATWNGWNKILAHSEYGMTRVNIKTLKNKLENFRPLLSTTLKNRATLEEFETFLNSENEGEKKYYQKNYKVGGGDFQNRTNFRNGTTGQNQQEGGKTSRHWTGQNTKQNNANGLNSISDADSNWRSAPRPPRNNSETCMSETVSTSSSQSNGHYDRENNTQYPRAGNMESYSQGSQNQSRGFAENPNSRIKLDANGKWMKGNIDDDVQNYNNNRHRNDNPRRNNDGRNRRT